jgi:hypothetical protein
MNEKKPDFALLRNGVLPLILSFFMLLPPSAGLGSGFVLLYSNDNRGETEPCG